MNSLAIREQSQIRVPRFVMPGHQVSVSTAMDTAALEVVDHQADPIKNMDDIIRIRDYLHEHERYRDELLFIMGINFGLRIGDLLSIRFGDMLTPELEYRSPVLIKEQKTKKPRKLYVNMAVHEAFCDYVATFDEIDFNRPLFEGYKGKHMTRQNVDYMFRKVMRELGLPYNCGTHMFRKTFAYWTYMTAPDSNRALTFLQHAFNHSSAEVTLHYAGITSDEIMKNALNLNLGYKNVIDVESSVVYTI